MFSFTWTWCSWIGAVIFTLRFSLAGEADGVLNNDGAFNEGTAFRARERVGHAISSISLMICAMQVCRSSALFKRC